MDYSKLVAAGTGEHAVRAEQAEHGERRCWPASTHGTASTPAIDRNLTQFPTTADPVDSLLAVWRAGWRG